MSVYIHIPFCTNICSYCDFPKLFKNDKYIEKYLDCLENEIKDNYKNELVSTLYIGGGTPTCLDLDSLKRLFKIVKLFRLKSDSEITIEANSEDLTIEKLCLLKKYVNRLSIGVQTFNTDALKMFNRSLNIKNIKNSFKYFDNINIDLIYAYENQKLEDLKYDLEEVIKLKPKHISAYSLIIEPNTKLYIDKYKKIDEDVDRKMYEYIKKTLKKNGYNQYEISNFCMNGFESKHNLTYWNNEHYFGFGLGASGYIDNYRYENTRSLTSYLKGVCKNDVHKLDKNETIQNELILGFRKIKGINKKKFKEKYDIDINDIVKDLLKKNYLNENKNYVYINPKYIYLSNEILINFIDLNIYDIV